MPDGSTTTAGRADDATAFHPHATGVDGLVFGAPSTDHIRPALLDDAALASAIERLRGKRRYASGQLAMAEAIIAGLAVVVVAGSLGLLWIGPTLIEEVLHGRREATMWELMAWWAVLMPLAAAGAAYGTVVLRRQMRAVRGWTHRVAETSARLAAALGEQADRAKR